MSGALPERQFLLHCGIKAVFCSGKRAWSGYWKETHVTIRIVFCGLVVPQRKKSAIPLKLAPNYTDSFFHSWII